MSNIEDKILDGPRVHYCDDGDDDIRFDDGSESKECAGKASSIFVRPDGDDVNQKFNRVSQRIPGGSTNTGPKGVIEDHKQSLCRKQNKSSTENDTDLEAEFQELLNDDSILREYISKRLSLEHAKDTPTFGRVYRLQSGTELLSELDDEKPNVLVLVHIYTKSSRTCKNVDKCLDELALELKHIKFVTLDASVAGLSANFKENGVPALLAYKGGKLIKSLVQLEELLDRDFNTVQIKELLADNGLVEISINQ